MSHADSFATSVSVVYACVSVSSDSVGDPLGGDAVGMDEKG